MPLFASSDGNTKPEAYKIISEPQIDAGRASGEPLKFQHIVLNFRPKNGDTRESIEKCEQFWEFINSQQELEGMMVRPTLHEEIALENQVNRESMPQRSSKVSNDNKIYQAVHTLNKIAEKDIVKTAFQTAVTFKKR